MSIPPTLMRAALPRRQRQRAFTLVELLVVLAILAVLIVILVPTVAILIKKGYRGKCASNVREISRACFQYAKEPSMHRGRTAVPYALPISSALTTSNWGSLTQGNVAGLWVLIDKGFAPRGVFLCPEAGSSRGKEEPAAAATEFTAASVSYSYLSQVAFPTTVSTDKSTLVIIADANPRCTPGTTGVTANNSACSANHDGEGQWVGCYDGSAKWLEGTVKDPTNDDDIYAANDQGNEDQGKRGDRDDVFLIP
ncbi:MAG: prepilin-type N-terminal cleavage/methylation domain-containing protein [Planctomycetaceae bacterium]|nr:prepilin-type N-terminal cleavage/methylation domain-containing protein [Planctomycetaceae bacterium]